MAWKKGAKQIYNIVNTFFLGNWGLIDSYQTRESNLDFYLQQFKGKTSEDLPTPILQLCLRQFLQNQFITHFCCQVGMALEGFWKDTSNLKCTQVYKQS